MGRGSLQNGRGGGTNEKGVEAEKVLFMLKWSGGVTISYGWFKVLQGSRKQVAKSPMVRITVIWLQYLGNGEISGDREGPGHPGSYRQY